MTPTPQQIAEAERLAKECASRLYGEYSAEWFAAIPPEQQPRYRATFDAAEKVRQKATALILQAISLPQLIAHRDEAERLRSEVKGTVVTWPNGSTSHVPRIELDKWVSRLNDALNSYYGTNKKRNSLESVVGAIAALLYDHKTFRTREAALMECVEVAALFSEYNDDHKYLSEALKNLAKAGVEVK